MRRILMQQIPEIVITGIGLMCPLGAGKDAVWESLQQGRSGVRKRAVEDGQQWPYEIASEVLGFEGKNYIKPRKHMKLMCREIQIANAASILAMQDAGLEAGDYAPERMGVVMGSELYFSEIEELAPAYRQCLDDDGNFVFDRWADSAKKNLYPLWMLQHLPNMAACHIGIRHDARGPNNSITIGESSGALAMIECASILYRGAADVMITGGSGARIKLTPMVYRGLDNLSQRLDDPAAASRPFDADRDGMTLGEGAACLVMETREHAEARGAKVLATYLGAGRTVAVSQEDREGSIRRASQMALQSAGIESSDIGFISAHATSSVETDQIEAAAIRSQFGDTPVTALKSFYGNIGAGCAGVEAAITVDALNRGQIPFTLNYDTPDPECPVNVVAGKMQPTSGSPALVLSQSDTRQSTAIVLGPA